MSAVEKDVRNLFMDTIPPFFVCSESCYSFARWHPEWGRVAGWL